MSRFTLLDRPTQLPMKCAVCNSGQQVVDLGVSIRKWGRLYICSGCVKNIAKLCNFVPQVELDALKERYSILRNLSADGVRKIKELEHVVDSLRRLDGVSDSLRNGSSVVSKRAVEGEGRTDSESSKQDSGSESGSVSKDAKLFEFS